MATIYLWEDALACGHDQTVEMYVPFDRSVRIGDTVYCLKCPSRAHNAPGLTTVVATRLVSQEKESEESLDKPEAK